MRISAAIDIRASVVAEDPTEVCHELPQSSRVRTVINGRGR